MQKPIEKPLKNLTGLLINILSNTALSTYNNDVVLLSLNKGSGVHTAGFSVTSASPFCLPTLDCVPLEIQVHSLWVGGKDRLVEIVLVQIKVVALSEVWR